MAKSTAATEHLMAKTAAGRAWAREWRVRNKAKFDALEASGTYVSELLA